MSSLYAALACPKLRAPSLFRSTSLGRAATLALIVAAGAQGAAHAASAPPQSETAVSEVVVTALKSSERLIDVPATVSAITAQRVREARIEQVKALAVQVPNIDIRETIPGVSPVITIRGVGLDDFSTTDNPAVGVYVDEVPLSSIALLNSDFFDIERVEVLKGPQGTLYGRNTVGGAVNIISAEPVDRFDASASAGYGSYETFDTSGMVNIPLRDGLALRLAGKTIQQERGFYTSNFLADGSPGQRDIGKRNVILGRVELKFEPNPNVSLLGKYEFQRVRSEMGQYKFFGTFVPGHPFALCAPVKANQLDNTQCSDAFGFTNTNPDRFNIDQAHPVPYDVDESVATLRARVKAGPAEITSITGYIDFSRAYRIDVDATPRDELDFIQRDKVRQFSQEVRAATKLERVDLLVGGFYSWDEDLGNNDDFIKQVPLVLFGFPSQNAKTTFDQTTNSAAAFANAVWHVTERLNLTTGVRYSWENRRYVGGTDYPLCPITPANPACARVGVSTTFADTTISDNNISWKIGADYRLGPNALAYASVSKGTKSGGFVTRFTTTEGQLLPYNPESLIAYEVGAKAQLGPLIALDGAAFHYDFKDFQTTILDGSLPVPLQRLGNVPGKSKLDGGEISAVLTPADGLTIQSGLGVLETQIARFTIGAVPFTNNKFPNAPEFTFHTLARYETPIADSRLRLVVQGSAAYESSAFKDASNNPFLFQHPFWLIDARVAIATEDRRWEIALWGKNLGNTQYTVSGSNLSGLGIIGLTTNDPRTYGVSITWRD